MNSIPIPLSSFLEEGVYIGNLYDFIDENEMIQIDSKIKDIHNYVNSDRESALLCRYDYEPPTHEYKHSLSLKEVPERDLFIEKNNYNTIQKWYEFEMDWEFHQYFCDLCTKILNTLYPNTEIMKNDRMGDFTLYEDGHFIHSHKDGADNGRLCVLIIYLTKESEYNDGGGELVVTTSSNKQYTIKPLLGTFSVLDFSKNDPVHEVKKVKNGFKRYAFMKFFKREII
jgi:Rps23 Pro-64 3,4-dihydroxylase Tpa1-like proline 4-hydroxylase